ncbi:hypothetical protein [Ruminococcus sp. JL13D9]|uniref:hypothetical protein n=1 Tax=Ruminococcus sp. JL13D9 TaxID=3233381 RepID=UPI003899D5DA
MHCLSRILLIACFEGSDYIDSGIVNDQYRLAKNDQVEIVSAHAKGDVDYLSDEVHILTYKKGDEQIELCVGFTSIAPDS